MSRQFGPPEYLSDESKELTLRVHDECNGSDVFGSDIVSSRIHDGVLFLASAHGPVSLQNRGS